MQYGLLFADQPANAAFIARLLQEGELGDGIIPMVEADPDALAAKRVARERDEYRDLVVQATELLERAYLLPRPAARSSGGWRAWWHRLAGTP
jgi:hypothetical protein